MKKIKCILDTDVGDDIVNKYIFEIHFIIGRHLGNLDDAFKCRDRATFNNYVLG